VPGARACFAGANRGRVLTAAFDDQGDHSLRLWDLADVKKEPRVLKGHTEPVRCLAASPDGNLAVSASQGNVMGLRLWDLEAGKERKVLNGHENTPTALAFSPDGKRILSGGMDNTLRLWDAASGRELALFKGHTAGITDVVFTPDGRRAVSASDDKTVRVWQLP
jgi:WD40 repeat protein